MTVGGAVRRRQTAQLPPPPPSSPRDFLRNSRDLPRRSRRLHYVSMEDAVSSAEGLSTKPRRSNSGECSTIRQEAGVASEPVPAASKRYRALARSGKSDWGHRPTVRPPTVAVPDAITAQTDARSARRLRRGGARRCCEEERVRRGADAAGRMRLVLILMLTARNWPEHVLRNRKRCRRLLAQAVRTGDPDGAGARAAATSAMGRRPRPPRCSSSPAIPSPSPGTEGVHPPLCLSFRR